MNWIDQIDNLFLFVTRFLISLYAIAQSVILWRWVFRKDRRIPRPVVVFTAGWHTVLLVMSTAIVLFNYNIATEWSRALYGSAFLGSLVGMGWMMHYGERFIEKIRNDHGSGGDDGCSPCPFHNEVLAAIEAATVDMAERNKDA